LSLYNPTYLLRWLIQEIDFLKRKELGLPVWAWGLVVAVVLFLTFSLSANAPVAEWTVDTLERFLTTGTPHRLSGGAGSLSPLTLPITRSPLVGTGAGDLTGASQILQAKSMTFYPNLIAILPTILQD